MAKFPLLIIVLCLRTARTSREAELDAFFGSSLSVPSTRAAPKDLNSRLDAVSDAAEVPGYATSTAPVYKYRYAPGVGVDAGGAFVWRKSTARTPAGARQLMSTSGYAASTYGSRRLLSGEDYNHPVVTGIHPSYGPIEGFTQITVVGANFHTAMEEEYQCHSSDNLVAPAHLTVINSTTLLCRSARHDPGVTEFMIMSSATNTYVEVSPNVTFEYHASMFVSDYSLHQVLRYNADTGEFVDVFVKPASGGLRGPAGMAFGLDHNFYVASEQTSSVLQYNGSSGEFLRKFCTVHGQPRGLVFHYLDLYVTSALYDRVYRYNGKTGSPRGIYIDNDQRQNLDAPWGIIFDKDTNASFISSQDTGHVYRYEQPAGGLYVGLGPAQFDCVWTSVKTPFVNGLDLTVDSLYTVGPQPGKAFVRFNRSTGEYLHHFEDEHLISPMDIQEYRDYVYVACEGGVRKYNRLNGEFIRTHTYAAGVDANSLLFHKTLEQNRGS